VNPSDRQQAVELLKRRKLQKFGVAEYKDD